MFQEKNILKPPKIEVVGIFPPNSKKKFKGKGKERKREVPYLHIHTLHLI